MMISRRVPAECERARALCALLLTLDERRERRSVKLSHSRTERGILAVERLRAVLCVDEDELELELELEELRPREALWCS